MHYGETKKVRDLQGDQFIQDFKKFRRVAIYAKDTERSFPALKLDVWAVAKVKKIYYITTETTMVIY
jgi:hypothetical protein